MSPSFSAARPLWVWSLPAFAVLLSLFWYRKKRGSLKTDSGGAGETRDDIKSVESDKSITFSDKSEIDSEGVKENDDQEKEKEEIIEVVHQLKVKNLVLESEIPPVVKDSEVTLNSPKEDNILKKEIKKEEEEVKKREEENQICNLTNKTEISNNQKDVIKEIEESIIVQKQEEKLEKVIEELVVSCKKEVPVSKSKCGKKKKMKNTGKKSNDPKVDLRQSKEENTACILEKKLAKLDLGNQCNINNSSSNNNNDNNNNPNNNNNNDDSTHNKNKSHTREEDKQRNEDVTERDSANNSPSEVMLASPSVSGYSDTHSEGSSDSGKGCSEMLTPSRTPASGNSVSGDLPVTSIYEFVIPQHLVGRLIGRYGSYVNEIKETTHASIYIKRHPDTSKLKICAIEGTQMDIDSALDMIRQKFPKKRYPNVTLEQVIIAPEPQMIPIISESMQLYLIEGINNDVLLSSLVSAGHFFLQQPTHPTYLSLSRLNSCMNYCYSEPDQPPIPEGVGVGILCAAPVHNGWYRAQIISMDEETKICEVKFVDYGGYMTMPMSMLRQIRFDFVNLPFQAAECYLASIKPINEETGWCDSAKKLVEKLTFGKVLQAQVYGYAEDGVPLIFLYTVMDDKVILVNEELVNLGLAEWIYWEVESKNVVGCENEESG